MVVIYSNQSENEQEIGETIIIGFCQPTCKLDSKMSSCGQKILIVYIENSFCLSDILSAPENEITFSWGFVLCVSSILQKRSD
jgi:hypothetical protein